MQIGVEVCVRVDRVLGEDEGVKALELVSGTEHRNVKKSKGKRNGR